jgi:hypothetical protein
MGLECEDPLDLGIDLHIIQLGREGMIRATRPQIHPHCRLLPLEWSNAVADKGL